MISANDTCVGKCGVLDYKNIFDLWKELGERVPFSVRRNTWSRFRRLTIVRVSDVKQTHTGLYGKAWTLDEWYGWVRKRDLSCTGEKLVSCAGCYQWKLVD